jgi:hypothetical protein
VEISSFGSATTFPQLRILVWIKLYPLALALLHGDFTQKDVKLP